MARGDLDDNDVHDLVLDLGSSLGVWVQMNQTSWLPLHPSSASLMAFGDFAGGGRDDVVVSFKGHGTWVWLDNTEWRQLHPKNPNPMTIWAESRLHDRFVASFPGEGVWTGSFDGRWQQIHQRDASFLLVADVRPERMPIPPFPPFPEPFNPPGREVVIGLAGAGVWVYDHNAVVWTRLHPFDVRSAVAGDLDGLGLDDLVIDFGPPYGLWILFNGGTWRPLHGFSAEHVALADLDGLGRDEIVIDFGALYGLWKYSTVSGWRPLLSGPIEDLLPGEFH